MKKSNTFFSSALVRKVVIRGGSDMSRQFKCAELILENSCEHIENDFNNKITLFFKYPVLREKIIGISSDDVVELSNK